MACTVCHQEIKVGEPMLSAFNSEVEQHISCPKGTAEPEGAVEINADEAEDLVEYLRRRS